MPIAGEDKLSHDLEQLEFAENSAATGRNRVNQIRDLRDSFAFGTQERRQAELVLVNVETLQTILEDSCHRIRKKISSHGP